MQQYFEEQASKCPKGAFVATRVDGFGQDRTYYETRIVTYETELVKAQEFLAPIGEMIEKMSPMVKSIPAITNPQVRTASDSARHSTTVETNDGDAAYAFQKFFEKSLVEYFRKFPEVDDRIKFFIEVEASGDEYTVALKTRPGQLAPESLAFLSRLTKRIDEMREKFVKRDRGAAN